jgi:crooked neck
MLYAAYTTFEKQFGDRSGIEDTVLGKRRIQYEEEIAHEPRDYDTWFDYVRCYAQRCQGSAQPRAQSRLEEDAYRSGTGDEKSADRVREVYERAIANTPPSQEKRHWRRYIFLFINYALFEETETKVR